MKEREGGNAMGSEGGSGMEGINLKVLKRILKFMEDAGLVEVELEVEGVKVRLKKSGADVIPTPVVSVPSLPGAAPAAPVAAPAPGAAEPAAPAASGALVVKAPMVGTFYRAPSPQSPPFVVAGDTVEEGQTLCLIEAMKLMNEIKAEKAGRIVKILVENGQGVEFDQPLFEFEAA